MMLKYGPVVAFSALMAFHSPAHAIFRFLNNLANCEKWTDSPKDLALANYERLSTPLPAAANRRVVPFRETDFQTKPWMNQFEIVVVINNSSPFLHHTDFPRVHPIPNTPADLGFTPDMPDDAPQALHFMNTFGAEAQKVRRFGELVRERNSRGALQPVRSNIPGAQTIRVYYRGKLVRVAAISTGRGTFELRDKNVKCSKRPGKSYFSITEPGYYTFQELIKTGYESGEWDLADMPNAMFYKRGRGLALHEVNIPAKLADLGKRASGGCTRLDPDTANNLFDLVKATEGATIPVIDEMGNPVLDARGQLTYKNREVIIYGEGQRNERRMPPVRAYSALLIIQPDPVVALNPQFEQMVNFRFQPDQPFTSMINNY